MNPQEDAARRAVETRRHDYLIRSITTSLLALAIVGIAAYQALVQDQNTGLFHDAALLVVGVYFGAHYGQNTHGLPRLPRRTDQEGE
jgi:malonyl CoA-acyl carrier protein transacylase